MTINPAETPFLKKLADANRTIDPGEPNAIGSPAEDRITLLRTPDETANAPADQGSPTNAAGNITGSQIGLVAVLALAAMVLGIKLGR